MDQNQVNQLFGMLQALNNKVDAFKDNGNNRLRNQEERLNNLQQRVRAVEDTVASLTGQAPLSAPHSSSSAVGYQGYSTNPLPRRGAYTAQQGHRGGSQQNVLAAPRIPGSAENAGYLPYAMEHIAKKHQRRQPGDTRECSYCGAETFSLSCFRLDHFRWCRTHQRPILPPHSSCGRNMQGCQQVKWEVHPEWDTLVQMSFAAGLGKQGVNNLTEKLFPRDDFPHKYDDNSNFVG